MPAPEQLKLIALDADDLAVISAHVQDARVQASDIVWRQDEKRLGSASPAGLEQRFGGTEPRRAIAALALTASWPAIRATSIWRSLERSGTGRD